MTRFHLYRVSVNRMGDEHSPARMPGTFEDATEACGVAFERARADNCRADHRWKVVNAETLRTVEAFGPYRPAPGLWRSNSGEIRRG